METIFVKEKEEEEKKIDWVAPLVADPVPPPLEKNYQFEILHSKRHNFWIIINIRKSKYNCWMSSFLFSWAWRLKQMA